MSSSTTTKKLFQAEQFMATKWASAEEKAKWANAMTSWVTRGFPQNGWMKSLYRPLSNMYGHIAHFDQHGFYATWFDDLHHQREWLEYVAGGGAYGLGMGDPTYTWSDVEQAFTAWIQQSGLVARYQKLCNDAIEAQERAQLTHLQEKYQPVLIKRAS